jgi:hypothetical protein
MARFTRGSISNRAVTPIRLPQPSLIDHRTARGLTGRKIERRGHGEIPRFGHIGKLDTTAPLCQRRAEVWRQSGQQNGRHQLTEQREPPLACPTSRSVVDHALLNLFFGQDVFRDLKLSTRTSLLVRSAWCLASQKRHEYSRMACILSKELRYQEHHSPSKQTYRTVIVMVTTEGFVTAPDPAGVIVTVYVRGA